MAEFGISVPRVAAAQARAGKEVPSLDQAKPGDLIVTRGGGHIGIYA
ncbi:C40 family peptidase [Nesterenkonia pannonica]|nr:C40 family peptidase [Nesterenkonia pannonica]